MSGLRAFAPPPHVLRVLLIEGAAELRIPISVVPHFPERWIRMLTDYLRDEGHLLGDSPACSTVLDIAFREGLLADWRCPAGAPGDVVWVQEMFRSTGEGWAYAVTDEMPDGQSWLPAHVMPREASRLCLQVVDVGIGEAQGGGLEWLAFMERR